MEGLGQTGAYLSSQALPSMRPPVRPPAGSQPPGKPWGQRGEASFGQLQCQCSGSQGLAFLTGLIPSALFMGRLDSAPCLETWVLHRQGLLCSLAPMGYFCLALPTPQPAPGACTVYS